MIDRALSNRISNLGVICAMLVALLHINPKVEEWSFTWCVDRLFNDGIGRVAVPFFFVVSGFFLALHNREEGWWGRAVSTRFRTLLVLYLIWNCLWILMHFMIAFFSNLVNGRDMVKNIAIPSLGLFVLPPLGPTWYIRTLFVFVFLSPIFIFALRRNAKITLGAGFLAYVMFYLSESVPFGTWRAIMTTLINLEGLAYFLVGITIAIDCKHRYDHKNLALPLLAVALVFTGIRIYCKSTGHLFLYNHTRFLVIPGFLWLLWKFTPSLRWPEWLTQSAFAIYLIHPFAIFMFKTLLHTQIDGFCQYLMCIAASILVPISVRFALSVISRPVAAIAFGGRI